MAAAMRTFIEAKKTSEEYIGRVELHVPFLQKMVSISGNMCIVAYQN